MKRFCIFILLASLSLLPSCAKAESDTPVTPTPAPVEPTVEFSHLNATWEITADIASAGEQVWRNDNRFFATDGDGEGKAFMGTSGGASVRLKSGNNICVHSLVDGCSIVFTWPSVSVAAGSTVEFMGTFFTSSTETPKYWIFEYLDGKQWKSVEEDLRTATEDPSVKYSFYLYRNNEQYETFAQSFTLENAIKNSMLQMRLRAVGKYNTGGGTLSATTSARFVFPNLIYRAASIDIWQGVTTKDTKKILQLGNSFSYYYSTCFMLKAIAASQGHRIRLRAFNKGSQFFYDFLELEKSLHRISDGGYDYAILQDQSQQHANYAADSVKYASVLKYSRQLSEKVKSVSPDAKIIIENTWAYAAYDYSHYGNYDDFYADLQKGCNSICAQTGATKSPIGVAFKKAKDAGITDLNYTDNTHPSRIGAYLKACVNYLTIYREKFDSHVPDLQVDPITAAKLRKIAEEVVMESL